MKEIFEYKFIPWRLRARNSDFEPSMTEDKKRITHLEIHQYNANTETAIKGMIGEVDESYNLTISEDGKVKVHAMTHLGALRALDTFTQLFYQHSGTETEVYTALAPVNIVDKPRFQHRGLNLDVARNWFPVNNILHIIDAVAWNKFNRLHLHMTDSQSWPLEIPAFPELSEKGAYKKGLSYSPEQLKEIQAYGAGRGVQVIIEIDMPGHTASIAYSKPELITAFNKQPNWELYAHQPPSGQLKLNDANVTDFVNKLLEDVLPRVSPYTSYFHTGGDELNVNAYLLDEGVKSNKTEVIRPLLQKFIDNAHEKVRAKGLTPIVWEEMTMAWNLTLGDDVLVQAWQNDSMVIGSVNKGHKTIAGNYHYWVSCSKQAYRSDSG